MPPAAGARLVNGQPDSKGVGRDGVLCPSGYARVDRGLSAGEPAPTDVVIRGDGLPGAPGTSPERAFARMAKAGTGCRDSAECGRVHRRTAGCPSRKRGRDGPGCHARVLCARANEQERPVRVAGRWPPGRPPARRNGGWPLPAGSGRPAGRGWPAPCRHGSGRRRLPRRPRRA